MTRKHHKQQPEMDDHDLRKLPNWLKRQRRKNHRKVFKSAV